MKVRRGLGSVLLVIVLLSLVILQKFSSLSVFPPFIAQAADDTPTRPGSLEVESLVIVDKSGQKLASLGPSETPGEGVGLKFFDKNKKARLTIMVVPGNDFSPMVILSDAKGTQRVVLELDHRGEPAFDLVDDANKINVFIRACDATGSGFFVSQKGKMRAALSGQPVERAARRATDGGQLRLYDTDENVISRLPNKK